MVDKIAIFSDTVASSGAQPEKGLKMERAEAFLLDQVPMLARAKIAPTLKTAYAAAGVLIASDPILQVPTASDNKGRIIQWAVDLGFQRLIGTGGWTYDYRWRPFERPTGRYLEIRASHLVMTISQVEHPTIQPRDVHFRANKRLNNKSWLPGMEPEDEKEVNGLPHTLILHGHQDLNFAHLAMPEGLHNAGYIYRSPNLMLMPHEISATEPPMEDTDVEAVMTLKEEIDRWRKDHGG
jgi:hypothetical protein